MNSILQKILTGLVVSRGTTRLDRETLRRIVDEAWIDNAPDGLCYAKGWARRTFNEAVARYVVDFHERTGRFPEGNHHVVLTSQRMIYFAPRSLAHGSGLRSPALSNAA